MPSADSLKSQFFGPRDDGRLRFDRTLPTAGTGVMHAPPGSVLFDLQSVFALGALADDDLRHFILPESPENGG